ncbi:c-type cytochrome biogenesis protein CcsB [Naasia sp. SYSU D00057]|uniref:c-type cytochrome biogenesis protein CcsB n=1 Tax=Naasia sp. SYSU D00057 TaxID=2817380 RepID=UPI0027DE079D|nr:c-type cytochrome biogenesis protein CcsB [Naasia sp. SYSU D00057]
MTQTLDEISAILLFSGMGVYALAFIAFTLDLARRSARADVVAESGAERIARARAGGSTATLERPPVAAAPAERASASLRVGVTLAVLGWLLHLGATVLRGVAAARVPWANMYEFAMTGTLLIMGVFLVLLVRRDLRFLGAIITGLVVLLLGISTVGFRVEVVPLPPALQSYWLVIHVLVAILATAFFTVGFALSLVQLMQARREAGRQVRFRMPASIPSSTALENSAYRVVIVGFIFWTFTLIAGAIWAEHAWGRYWGWDTKEVWTFIIWTIYAGYIHARATRGWRGSRSAWLAIVGYSAVLFNFGIVNVFFKGLHAYSGL